VRENEEKCAREKERKIESIRNRDIMRIEIISRATGCKQRDRDRARERQGERERES